MLHLVNIRLIELSDTPLPKVVFVSLNPITPMFSYNRGHTEGITADSCAIWTGVQQESFSSKYWPRNNHWISCETSPQLLLSSILSPGYNHLRNILDIPLTLVIEQIFRISISYPHSLWDLPEHGVIPVDACNIHLKHWNITIVFVYGMLIGSTWHALLLQIV